jgi:hypothetical protein
MTKTLEFDAVQLSKIIKEKVDPNKFILIVYDPKTGDVRQFSNGAPESQLYLMKRSIQAMEGIIDEQAPKH